MKKSLLYFILLQCSLPFNHAYSQGWVAEIDITINHSKYAYQKITKATVTLAGTTATGSSANNKLHLQLKGNNAPSGNISIVASGLAWEPYIRTDPYNASISATYSGTYVVNCANNYFNTYDGTNYEQVSGSFKIYPRLEISNIIQQCDQLTLISNTCSSVYTWEVSNIASGTYQVIEGSAPTIPITPQQLFDLGLGKYGRKYFRVRGLAGTTSQIQPVDIFYPGPTANSTVISPKCNNQSNGSIQVDITSPLPSSIDDFVITLFKGKPPSNPVQQKSITNTSSVSFVNLTAGQYWVRIENNSSIGTYGSCWIDHQAAPLIDPTEVTISSIEASDYNGYAIKCDGGSDGTLEAKATGGTGKYSQYVWTPDVSATNFATDLKPGLYKVKTKDSNECWSKEYSKTLAVPEPITMTLQSTGGKGGFDVSCADANDGQIVASVSGGVTAYYYEWSNEQKTSALSATSPGTYKLTVTDKNGCTNKDSITLFAPPAIDFSIGEISKIHCPGNHSGALEVQSIINAIGQVAYLWSSGESGMVITDKPEGIYSLTVSDEQGCHNTKSITLLDPNPYSLDLIATSVYNGSAIKCKGETNGELATIVKNTHNEVTTADYYTWYKDGTQISAGPTQGSLTSLGAGDYKVVIDYDNVCNLEKTFALHEPAQVLVNISVESSYNGFAISCFGKSDARISVSAAGGTGNKYSYHWQTGDTTSNLINITAGSYAISVKDVNGCEGTAQIKVEEPMPVVTAITVLSNFHGLPISCYGNSDAHLNGSAKGGTASFNYSWNTGVIGPELNNIKAGNYTLTGRDENGCESRADTVISDPTPVIANIVISDFNRFGVKCNGGRDGYIEAHGSGGTGVFDYTWQGISSGDSIQRDISAGNYSVTVRDENGCLSTQQAILTEPPILTLGTAETKNISCYKGTNGEIKLSVEGGSGNYRYSVDALGWQTVPGFNGLKAGIHELVVQDANGCSQRIDQSLSQPRELSITFDNIQPAFCGDPKGKVSAIVTGGTGDYGYEWSDADKNIISTEKEITSLRAGIYYVKTFDENDCEATGFVGITSLDGPKASIENIVPAKCSYSFDGGALLQVKDGKGPYSFLWPDGQDTQQGSNLSMGNYLVQITDKNNCSVIQQVTIPAPDAITINLLEKIEPSCHGECDGKLSLAATGGSGDYTFHWTDFQGAKLEKVCGGQYEVQVEDKNSCIAKASFLLTYPEPVNIKLVSNKSPICNGSCDGQLEVAASGGTGDLKFAWSSGQTTSMLEGLCAGSYTAIATDFNNCQATKIYTLIDPGPVPLDLGKSVTLCPGQSHTLDPGSNWKSYLWGSSTGFTSSTPQITIEEAGRYWLKVANTDGCAASDTFLLQTSPDLLKANFLLASQAMEYDTVVAIEISWPLPQYVSWTLPDEMKQVEYAGDVVTGKFESSGEYNLSLKAGLGECVDEITKTILIVKRTTQSIDGRLGIEPVIKTFNLFPIPNDGNFKIAIELTRETPVVLTIWSNLTGKKIAQFRDRSKGVYLKEIDLRPLTAGAYSVRLDCGKATKAIRFIVR
jgi:hypothetical protein